MSRQNAKLTVGGHPRTRSDSHPYMRVIFWAKDSSRFWDKQYNTLSYDCTQPNHNVRTINRKAQFVYTDKSREYFEKQMTTLLNQRHNALLIQDAQTWVGAGELR